MAADDDAARDDEGSDAPFAPPPVPIEVHCLHCGEAYGSWQMQARNEGPDGDPAWCCPTPGCDGLGFCFDVWPVDPEWRDEHGELVYHACDEGDFDFDGTVDPAIIDRYWRVYEALPHPLARDEVEIDVDGDAEHPLIRLFGEEARGRIRVLRDDDIPF